MQNLDLEKQANLIKSLPRQYWDFSELSLDELASRWTGLFSSAHEYAERQGAFFEMSASEAGSLSLLMYFLAGQVATDSPRAREAEYQLPSLPLIALRMMAGISAENITPELTQTRHEAMSRFHRELSRLDQVKIAEFSKDALSLSGQLWDDYNPLPGTTVLPGKARQALRYLLNVPKAG